MNLQWSVSFLLACIIQISLEITYKTEFDSEVHDRLISDILNRGHPDVLPDLYFRPRVRQTVLMKNCTYCKSLQIMHCEKSNTRSTNA